MFEIDSKHPVCAATSFHVTFKVMIDTKLSSILHLLLHMAQSERPFTSEELAGFLETNPVVVRRMLAGLRDLGYVSAGKGHGG